MAKARRVSIFNLYDSPDGRDVDSPDQVPLNTLGAITFFGELEAMEGWYFTTTNEIGGPSGNVPLMLRDGEKDRDTGYEVGASGFQYFLVKTEETDGPSR